MTEEQGLIEKQCVGVLPFRKREIVRAPYDLIDRHAEALAAEARCQDAQEAVKIEAVAAKKDERAAYEASVLTGTRWIRIEPW